MVSPYSASCIYHKPKSTCGCRLVGVGGLGNPAFGVSVEPPVLDRPRHHLGSTETQAEAEVGLMHHEPRDGLFT